MKSSSLFGGLALVVLLALAISSYRIEQAPMYPLGSNASVSHNLPLGLWQEENDDNPVGPGYNHKGPEYPSPFQLFGEYSSDDWPEAGGCICAWEELGSVVNSDLGVDTYNSTSDPTYEPRSATVVMSESTP